MNYSLCIVLGGLFLWPLRGLPQDSTGNVRRVLSDKTIACSSQIINKVALLPESKNFAGKRLNFVIDDVPQRLDCK